MTPWEIDKALNDAVLLVDTREHNTKELQDRIKQIGWEYERKALCFGDYSLKVNGVYYDNEVVIERKMSIDEICGNFGKNHERFRREFNRAKDVGARVYLLVEDASWEQIINHSYRSRIHPNSLMASILAFQCRYDCRVVFCRSKTAPIMIKNILIREVKERLSKDETL